MAEATRNTLKARAARQACLNALKGIGESGDARQAFQEAAAEAGILIGDVDRLPEPSTIVKSRR
jgi:hypothetical protein